MTPWLGRPTSYASGYIRHQRTSTESQSLTVLLSSPPTYWIGFCTRGSSGSSRGKTDSTVMDDQPTRLVVELAAAGMDVEEPPYDRNGSGSPVIGMIPSVIPMLTNVWKANQHATPPATSRPKRSGDR